MSQAKKRNYSAMNLEEVMEMLGQDNFQSWQIPSTSRPPSSVLQEVLHRLDAFDLQSSESAKTLLIDALFIETVPLSGKLKVWKEASLSTDTLTGVADYLIAPHRAYLATPFFCVTEAKRDDFEKGRVQCLAEMLACRWNNTQKQLQTDVFGIVSNGQGWEFYKLAISGSIFQSGLYTSNSLSELLGVLDYICAECAKNVA
jgi:hypothetical protein